MPRSARRATIRPRAARRIGRPSALLVTAVAALFVAGTTFAYFTTTGSGLLSAIVGSLGQPSINSTTAGDGKMTLGWSSVAAPGGQGTVSYYVTRNGGTPAGNCPTSAAPSTVTSCTDTGLAPGTYNYTVTAVWGTWTSTSATSSPTVTVGTLNHFSVTVPATSTAGSAFNVTVAAKDVNNSTLTSYVGTIHFTSTDGQAALPPDYTFVAGDNGSHTFTSGATLKTAGSKTVDVKDTTQTSVTGSGSVTVNPAGAASLSLAAATTSPTAGAADNLTITAQDAFGNTATTYAGSKNLTFSGPHAVGANNPTVSNSSGTAINFGTSTAITFTNGVASVSGSNNGVMKLYKVESVNVVVSDGAINNGSGLSVSVGSASAASLSLSAASTSPTAGAADNLTITALDTYGNTASGYTGSKNLTFSGANTIGTNHPTVSDSAGTAVNFGTSTAITFTNGVASVSGSNNGVMKLYKVESVNIVVSDGTVNNGTGMAVTVSAAAAGVLAITPTGTSGSTSSSANLGPLTVAETDPYGNTSTTAETVNLSSSAGSSFATSQFGSSVTSVSIPGGSSSTTFYFGNTTTGTKTITAAAAGLTSGTQTVTTTTAPAGLFISITSHTGGTLTQSGCSTVSANYTCTVTGTGNAGSITFNVLFTNSGGTGVVYSTSQSSIISMSGQSSGSTTIAANSTTSGTTLTATHPSTTTATSTLTFGPYTLNVAVGK